jgi:nicotinamidase/pyrazinamidase
MQYDFCSPGGSLYIMGAEQDINRAGNFISTFSNFLDHIILTMDNHNVIDISHQVFWKDDKGNSPRVFTVITKTDVLSGKWIPQFEKEKAVEYVEKLEIQGEFPHVIWPEHCIIGSHGAAIMDEVMEPVKVWARKGNFYDVVVKGTNPLTEHFGALMANIPIEGSPETQLNIALVNKFRQFDRILIMGEARSHCVAMTIKQMLNIDGIAPKLIILKDCMSDVIGFQNLATPVFEKAMNQGAQFILSTDKLFW